MNEVAATSGFFSIYSLSEQAVTIELGNAITEELMQRIRSWNEWIVQHPFPGFLTTVPAYSTLTIFFDPLQVAITDTLPGTGCFEKVSNYIAQLNHSAIKSVPKGSGTFVLPVCYGGQLGPDLNDVAAKNRLSPEQVIAIHTGVTYRVHMIGFVPGFAYLGGMDKRIAMPRKAIPRDRIPAGAVGIADQQTGIYPLQTPGGWQIIGQTPLQLFDADREEPSLLKAGDHVRFESIDLIEFERLK